MKRCVFGAVKKVNTYVYSQTHIHTHTSAHTHTHTRTTTTDSRTMLQELHTISHATKVQDIKISVLWVTAGKGASLLYRS